MSLRSQMRYMNPYEIHKAIVNDYILRRPGDTRLLKRDCSKDRTDFDVIRQNHRFLWNDAAPDTWEAQFAKKYYDKLFKEYCIGDLSLYKENKVALRWRTEQEVVDGKGQFTCGNKSCASQEGLRTWEVNFGYKEHGEKKNALVKIRLCCDCSMKLNYHSTKREIKRLKSKSIVGHKQRKRRRSHKGLDDGAPVGDDDDEAGPSKPSADVDKSQDSSLRNQSTTESPWENLKPIESKSRDEEMEDYLQELLL